MKPTYTELGKDCGLYQKPEQCGKYRRNKHGCKLCKSIGDWKR